MNISEAIKVKPVPKKLSIFRKLFRNIPGFCSHCGMKYVKAHSKKINLLCPVPQNGRFCPNGHEGYIDEFVMVGYVRHSFNNVPNVLKSGDN